MSEICELKSEAKPGDMNLNTGCFGYGSYLFSRKGTLYFRIAVSNYLHSLLKKKEIRKSLGTGRLRESRPLVLRYAVPGSEYFLLAEKVLAAWFGRIRKQYCSLLMLRRKITVQRIFYGIVIFSEQF